MVFNVDQILDEGEIKYIEHYKIMPRNLEHEYQNKYSGFALQRERYLKYQSDLNTNAELDKMIKFVSENEPDVYKAFELQDTIRKRKVKPVQTYNPEFMEHPTEMSKSDIYEYYGVDIFHPCWMLNISPDWKGEISQDKISHFKAVMGKFFDNCNRFSRMKYVIEGGSEANFLHVHAVFEFNPSKQGNLKAMRKGNLLREFRKIWDKHGYIGLIKARCALQTTYITTPTMLKDKLDYLIEDLKPLSHRNAEEFPSIIVGEW